MATLTILGVFEDPSMAKRALEELRASAIELKETSMIAQGQADAEKLTAPEGALVGAAWGGLVGLVALAIPGIGPFIAGGAIAAALTGAAAGAVVGGIGGALMQNTNLSEAEAQRYEGEVRQGKTLVVVKADEQDALHVRRILAHDGAESIRENQSDLTAGGTVDVAMYDAAGQHVPFRDSTSGVVDVERGPNSVTTTEMFAHGNTLSGDRLAALNETSNTTDPLTNNVTSGREASFDTEDRGDVQTPLANGARVTSFEDAEKPTTDSPAPRDVPAS